MEALRGGQSAGTALGGMLFGEFSPAGRMPYSVVAGAAQLPPFGDMDMLLGRSYRYYNATKFGGTPLLYRFGDGTMRPPLLHAQIRWRRIVQPVSCSLSLSSTRACSSQCHAQQRRISAKLCMMSRQSSSPDMHDACED